MARAAETDAESHARLISQITEADARRDDKPRKRRRRYFRQPNGKALGNGRGCGFKPVEHAMISIGSRLLPPRRHDLGDNDPMPS